MSKKALKKGKLKSSVSPQAANEVLKAMAEALRKGKKSRLDDKRAKETYYALQYLAKHFEGINLDDLVSTARTFPATSRVDLQRSLEFLFSNKYQAKLFGLHKQYIHGALSFNDLLAWNHDPVAISPLHHEDVDIGEDNPERCLIRGLWLAESKGEKFALVLCKSDRYGSQESVHIEIAVEPGKSGFELSQKFLHELEKMVAEAGSYRGKVVSLEAESDYSGTVGSVKVHKLRVVTRDEVILPAKTLELLDRNVMDFVSQRGELRKLKMPVKKGLLFYGPPGTGKTHTAHYLANQLPDHTTLLITSGQVGLLPEYFQLARFLQPSMVIIEDVDLIARERSKMRNSCEESLLNYLLNEMDGLREDAEVLFILTTNHAASLESALASRPGRIDQAIEFPLPDAPGRKKLVQLYSRDLKISVKLVNMIVKRTDQATPAFIKELMRRSAQYLISDRSRSKAKLSSVEEKHINMALEDMLFAGGSLNRNLLGGAGVHRE